MSVLLTSGMTPPPSDEEIREGIRIAANLIAAAPDLLAVCKALQAELNCLKWGRPYAGRPHALMDAADTAIAKAEARDD